MNIISIGEVLWDVFGDTELLGGGAFNFCAHAKILGHSVSFISAVGDDHKGAARPGKDGCYGPAYPFRPQGKGLPHRDSHRQPRLLRASRISSFTGPLPTISPNSRMGTSENFHLACLTGFISERCFR